MKIHVCGHFHPIFKQFFKSWFFFEYPSVPHRPSQFNTSVQRKDHTISAPKIATFNTKKPLSSTHPLVQHTPQFNIKNPSVQHQKRLSSTHPSVQHQKSSLNWGVFGGWKEVALLCWTEENPSSSCTRFSMQNISDRKCSKPIYTCQKFKNQIWFSVRLFNIFYPNVRSVLILKYILSNNTILT